MNEALNEAVYERFRFIEWDIILASIHSLFIKGSIQSSNSSYSGPTGKNLKLFIDFEEQDYNERVAATRRGVSKDRSLPCQISGMPRYYANHTSSMLRGDMWTY